MKEFSIFFSFLHYFRTFFIGFFFSFLFFNSYDNINVDAKFERLEDHSESKGGSKNTEKRNLRMWRGRFQWRSREGWA